MNEIATPEDNSEPQAAELVNADLAAGPGQLLQQAIAGNASIETLERMTALYERWEAQQAVKAFNAAMNKVQAAIGPVTRDAANDSTHSRYVRYETMGKAITPVYTAHGFSISHDEEDSPHEGQTRYVAIVRHEDGHSESYHLDLPIDNVGLKGNANKTAVHGKVSASSYARRVLEARIFNVRFCNEDDDGNAAGAPDTISDEQLTKLKEAFEFSGMPQGRLLKWGRVSKLEDLAAIDFDKAMQTINAFADKQGT